MHIKQNFGGKLTFIMSMTGKNKRQNAKQKDFVFRNNEEKGSLVSIRLSFGTSWFLVSDCTVMHE